MQAIESKEFCCACLKTGVNLNTTSELDSKSIDYATKLRFCVPEVEWSSGHICLQCTGQLNRYYAFKEQCIKCNEILVQKNMNCRSDDNFSFGDEKLSVFDNVENSSVSYSMYDNYVKIEVPDFEEDHKEESPERKCDEVKDTLSHQKTVVKQHIDYLSCEFCDEIVGLHESYIIHCVEEHGSAPEMLKPYICKECKERFRTSTLLSRHLLQHSGRKVHICSFCGKGFTTRKDMLNHEKIHSNKREMQCELCSKRFHTKSYLRSHKLAVHTDPMRWKFVCPFCGKRFPIKSNYEHHVRRHTGEKPFACHLCEKRFSNKNVLQQHFNSHSNVRAFKCDQCDKEYKNARVAGIHMKKVHGIGNYKVPVRPKKFVCDICPKSFAARNKLLRHMCSHTGERPWACHICEKKFSDKSYLTQHLKSAHNLPQTKQE